MLDLLWFLLPVAAASGWLAARRSLAVGEQTTAASSPAPSRGLNYWLNEGADSTDDLFIQQFQQAEEPLETQLALGRLLRARGEVDRAIRLHQELLARPALVAAERSATLLELGRDYLKAGLLDRAESLLRELVGHAAGQSEALQHLRELYEQERDWSQAIWACEQLELLGNQVQRRVKAQYCCELANQAWQEGREKQALTQAREALRISPDCVRASMLLGEIALGRQQFAQGLREFARVPEQDIEFLPLALPRLRTCYQALGQSAQLIAYLRELKTRTQASSLVIMLADVLRGEGQLTEAESLLRIELERCNGSLRVVRDYLVAQAAELTVAYGAALQPAVDAMDEILRRQAVFQCCQCGFEGRHVFWQCPGCHGWGCVKPIEQFRTGYGCRPANA